VVLNLENSGFLFENVRVMSGLYADTQLTTQFYYNVY